MIGGWADPGGDGGPGAKKEAWLSSLGIGVSSRHGIGKQLAASREASSGKQLGAAGRHNHRKFRSLLDRLSIKAPGSASSLARTALSSVASRLPATAIMCAARTSS